MTGPDVGVAVGAEHEHRQLGEFGGQVAEEGEGALVRSVQVVDHGQQAPGARSGQERRHGLEQPEAVWWPAPWPRRERRGTEQADDRRVQVRVVRAGPRRLQGAPQDLAQGR